MANLTITASQVLKSSGDTKRGTAGAAITAGAVVYLDVSASTYKLAQCDGTAEEATVEGIALNDAATSQPFEFQTGGTITLGAGAAPTEGEIYVLSATAGAIAPEADVVTSTNYVHVLGVGGATNTLVMGVNNSGQQIA